MGRKKVSSTKKKKGSLSQNTDILGAVYIVISLILIVFLSFSNIGDIPDFINELLKGLFGYMAYLIPVVLGFVGIYSIVSNKKIMLTHELGKGFAIMMCVVITISSFAITDFSMFDNILKYISNTYNAALNGTNFVGLIGSMITCLGVKVVGIMATRLIFITATLITILCAFNISLRQLFYAIYNIFAYIFNCIYSICAILFRKDETINEQLEFEKEQKVSRRERLANEKELKHKIELEKKLFESGSSEVEKNLKSDNCDQIEFDFNKLGGRVCDNEIQAKQQRDEFFKKQKEQKVDKDVKEVLTLDHVNHVEVDNYVFPPIDLLKVSKMGETFDKKAIHATAVKLQKTLASFGVEAKVTNITHGPTVTRYELTPNTGVKVSKIVNLCDDIALNLAAKSIRIEAPIPGRAAVGIEVPNISPDSVSLREVIESQSFIQHKSSLAFALGKDAAGELVTGDISKMPHTLIAGATGSGKSVCINSIIVSILYKAKPSEVKMILVDPKMVELSGYNGIPHLLIPVVTDPKKAAGALNWAVQEMVNRYNLFASKGVKDIKGYNAIMEKDDEAKLPQMVIIIDELADLMMVAPNDVEEAICRLAQMARAARYAFDNCYSTSIC